MALLLAGTLSVSAQHYIGVKGGYGAAQGRLFTSWGVSEGAMIWNRYTGGVVWKYYSPQPVWGGLAAELEYQQRGYRVFGGSEPGESFIVSDSTAYTVKTRTVSTLTLPLVWQPHLYMMDRKVRVWLSAGVTLSYNLGMGDEYTVTNYDRPEKIWDDEENNRYHWGPQTATSETVPYNMQTARDVRWNYGWLGGVGVGVLMDRWEFFVEGRYYYGMSDILRTKTKYQFNDEEPIRSELDNIYITMGVCFRLGKGGILEPPLRKRRAPSGADDFRNIKLDM
jgi:hypothetical protein